MPKSPNGKLAIASKICYNIAMHERATRPNHLRAVPDSPVNPRAFWEVIEAPATRNRVSRTITKVFKFEKNVRIEPVEVGFSPDDRISDQGSVVDMRIGGLNKSVGIGTSLGFPMTLFEKADLTDKKALKLAADFVTAYGVLTRGQEKGFMIPRHHTFATSHEAPFWSDVYNVSPIKAVPFRAAAQIALEAQSMQPLLIDADSLTQPIQPHISALQNPLPLVELRQLHDIARAGR